MKGNLCTIGRLGLVLAISSAVFLRAGTAKAEDVPDRVDIGLGLRFMPAGWFNVADRDLRAYPALGFSPFVDVRVNRVLSIGIGAEAAFNIIPNLAQYMTASMFGASLRLKLEYPNTTLLTPYVLLCPGYSVIRLGERAAGVGSSADGVVLAAYAGARLRLSRRHSLLGEIGYMWGAQKLDRESYAPSYVVTALGWQMAF